MANGRYVISKTIDGQYSFTLYSVGGRVLAVSGAYSCLSVCKKGIASLRVNSDAPLCDFTLSAERAAEEALPKCPRIELFKLDTANGGIGGFNFRVLAKNGNVIATGERGGYGTKSSCLDIISALRANAFSASTESV